MKNTLMKIHFFLNNFKMGMSLLTSQGCVSLKCDQCGVVPGT